MPDRLDYKVSANDAMKTLTLNIQVVGMRTARIRWHIGKFFLYVAAWIMGCGINVEMEKN